MHWLWLTAPGAIMWVGLLLLPWRPWSTRERLDAPAELGQEPGRRPASLRRLPAVGGRVLANQNQFLGAVGDEFPGLGQHVVRRL